MPHRLKLAAICVSLLGTLCVTGSAGAHETGAGARSFQGDLEGGQNLGEGPTNLRRFEESVRRIGTVGIVEIRTRDLGLEFLPVLSTKDGRKFGLYGELPAYALNGRIMQVEGLAGPPAESLGGMIAGDVLVSDVEPSQSDPRKQPLDREGPQGFLLAYVSWPGSGASSYGQDVAKISGLTDWSRAASDGGFEWNPVRAVEVKLDRPLEGCGAGNTAPLVSWVNAVRSDLARQGVDLAGQFRTLGIALPDGSTICNPSALAYAYYSQACDWMAVPICGLSVYNYGATTRDILVHELGHNLGLPHSNTALCSSGGSFVTIRFTNSTCSNLEYADILDPMGYSSGADQVASFNPAYVDELGWLKERDVSRISIWGDIDRTVRLQGFGVPGSPRVIQATLPQVGLPGGQAYPGRIYIEYRTPSGLDAALWDQVAPRPRPCGGRGSNEIYLRFVPSDAGAAAISLPPPGAASVRSSLLVDTDLSTPPNTAEYICDAGLVPGDSWEDETGRLRVDFLERSPDLSTATVRVRSQGLQGGGSEIDVEKAGAGNGRIVSVPAGIDCSGRCAGNLGEISRLRLIAKPAKGSRFSGWGTGDCARYSKGRLCNLDFEGTKKVVRGEFRLDPSQTDPDVEVDSLRILPAKLKVRAGKKARIRLSVRNRGLDLAPVSISLRSGKRSRVTVPRKVSLEATPRGTTRVNLRASTSKRARGKVRVFATLGESTVSTLITIIKKKPRK